MEQQKGKGREMDQPNDAGTSLGNTSTAEDLLAEARNFRALYGRTYHNFSDTAYWLPNDEAHMEHLDLGHRFFKLLFGEKLYLAPIGPNLKRVLDIGTGTGIWAIDFADDHPSAVVIGTDLSPIQPSLVPPNCSFELEDAQLVWRYPDDSIDFIHVRSLAGGISDWQAFYAEAFKCTAPGGWIEQVEIMPRLKRDGHPFSQDHLMTQCSELLFEAGDRMGKSFKIAETAKELIKSAGFEEVVSRRYRVPIGDWPTDPKLKILGRYNLLFVTMDVEAWLLFPLTKVLGWDYLQAQAFIERVRKALHQRVNCAYYELTVVYGRKP